MKKFPTGPLGHNVKLSAASHHDGSGGVPGLSVETSVLISSTGSGGVAIT